MDLSFLDKFAVSDVSDTSPTGHSPAGATRGAGLFARHLELRSSEPPTGSPGSHPATTRDVESQPTGAEQARADDDAADRVDTADDQDRSPVSPPPAEQHVAPTTPAEIACANPESSAVGKKTPAANAAASSRSPAEAESAAKSAPQAGTATAAERHGREATEPNVPDAPAAMGATRETDTDEHTAPKSLAPPPEPLLKPDNPSSRWQSDGPGKKTKTNAREPRIAAGGAHYAPGNHDPSPAGDAAARNVGRPEQPTLQIPLPDQPEPPTGANAEQSGTSDRAEHHTQADSSSRSLPLTQRLSEHLLGRGHMATGNGTEHPHVDQRRLMQRVARAVQAASQRGGILRLRLSPPELGSLQLEVTINKGVLSAKLETESHVVRAVLLDNLPQLRDRLEEQGMRVVQFDVDVSQGDTQDSASQPNLRDPSFQPQATTRRLSPQEKKPAENLETVTTPNASMPGKLNVVV